MSANGGAALKRVVLLAWCWALAACSGEPATNAPRREGQQEASTVGRPAPAQPTQLQSVSLPDFSTLAPAVRKQLEGAAAEFTRRIAQQGAPEAERGTAYGEFGMLLLAAGFRATAATCFVNAEVLNPRELRWPYFQAHIHRREGRSLEAAAAFERALRLEPTFVPALVWLGNAYLDRADAGGAERQFSKALAVQRDTVAAIFGLGRAALARNDHASAITHFERALALDPGAAAVHRPLGLAYRAAGRLQEAQAHLAHEGGGEIRVPDPLDVHIPVETAVNYQSRGERALEAGDWPIAITSLQRAVTLAPDDPAIRHKYATALALGGDAPAARAEFETLARRWPRFEKGQYSLGVIKADAGDIPGAIAAFRRAAAAAPNFLEPRLQLAHLLRRTGRPVEALPEYAHVLAVDPRVADARFGRAMTLVALKRYAEARAELEEGRRLHAEQVGFALALIRLMAAAPDERVRDGVKGVSIADSIPPSERRIEWAIVRAMALAEAGRFDEAVQLQRAVIASLEKNGSSQLARTQEGVLRIYESRRPTRTPWQRDEPMELPDSGIVAHTP